MHYNETEFSVVDVLLQVLTGQKLEHLKMQLADEVEEPYRKVCRMCAKMVCMGLYCMDLSL